MLRRIVQLLILLPLAVILIAFSLANRDPVLVSFDPLGETDTLSVSMPLFLLVFICLLTGVLIGGAATWFGQGKWRRQAKREHREAERWRHRANEAMRRTETTGSAVVPTATRREG